MAHGQETNQTSTPDQEVNKSSTHVLEIAQTSTPGQEVNKPSTPVPEINLPAATVPEISQSSAPAQEINQISAPGPLEEIGPGGGDPGDPGDLVICPSDMWVCPCSPEVTCSAVELPPEPSVAECYIELFYRPVTVTSYDLPIGAYHTFWWTEQTMTNNDVIERVMDGGPTSPGLSCFTTNNCGTLFAALSIGDVGYYAADNIYSATPDLPDSYGPSLAQCRASWDLQDYTSTWPGGTIAYKILGPNSNTFAYEASIAAVLTTTEPPVYVPGWLQ